MVLLTLSYASFKNVIGLWLKAMADPRKGIPDGSLGGRFKPYKISMKVILLLSTFLVMIHKVYGSVIYVGLLVLYIYFEGSTTVLPKL